MGDRGLAGDDQGLAEGQPQVHYRPHASEKRPHAFLPIGPPPRGAVPRLIRPFRLGQIPARCRTFTGKTHDLPYLPANHAGICRDLSAQ